MKFNPAFVRPQVIGGIRFKRDHKKLSFYKVIDSGNDSRVKLSLLKYNFHHVYAGIATFVSEKGDFLFKSSPDGYQKPLPEGIYTDKKRAYRFLLNYELENLEGYFEEGKVMNEEEAEFEWWCKNRSKAVLRAILKQCPELGS